MIVVLTANVEMSGWVDSLSISDASRFGTICATEKSWKTPMKLLVKLQTWACNFT